MSIINLFSPMQSFYLTQQMLKNGSETIDVNWNHQADFLYIILSTALIMAFQGKIPELAQLIDRFLRNSRHDNLLKKTHKGRENINNRYFNQYFDNWLVGDLIFSGLQTSNNPFINDRSL